MDHSSFLLFVLNGFIHIGLIALAIREYRKEKPEGIANYLSGVAMGMYTSLIGVLGFTLFMVLFLSNDPTLMDYIQSSIPIGKYINPFTASLFILVEGVVVSLIGSYIVTRVIDMNMAGDQAWERYRR